jgi:hypothetical protein
MEASCFGGRGDVKDGPKARRLRRSRSLTSPLPPKNPHPCARRTGFDRSRHRCAWTPRSCGPQRTTFARERALILPGPAAAPLSTLPVAGGRACRDLQSPRNLRRVRCPFEPPSTISCASAPSSASSLGTRSRPMRATSPISAAGSRPGFRLPRSRPISSSAISRRWSTAAASRSRRCAGASPVSKPSSATPLRRVLGPIPSPPGGRGSARSGCPARSPAARSRSCSPAAARRPPTRRSRPRCG